MTWSTWHERRKRTKKAVRRTPVLSVIVAQRIERMPGVREVMGSNPDFSLTHAFVMLINSLSYISLQSLRFTIFTHLSSDLDIQNLEVNEYIYRLQV